MTLSLALLEPSTLDNVPEELDGVLDSSSLAICCSFNRKGSLLAVGCNDGRVVIWDFLTRGVAKNIPAHASRPVCSISWSRNGHKLASASLDNSVAIWEVLTGECLMRLRMPSPILKTQFNPRNDRFILVCFYKHPSILIQVDYEASSVDYKLLPIDKEETDFNIIASFDRRGQHIYTGNYKGKIVIIRCPKSLKEDELEIVSSFKIVVTGSTPAAVREIEFGARNKTKFLVNSSDRTIRLYDCKSALEAGINGHCEEIRKFQDLVNKTMWRRCCFSGDPTASYVCGGSTTQHYLQIWETEKGTIKKMLQGTMGELLLDVQWHPLRPILASISSGLVSVWTRPQIENWSAFAPDFKELEENQEYDERESEFDAEDEDNHRINTSKETNVGEAEDVDVTQVQPESELISSDEEEADPDCLDFIPITLEDYELTDQTQNEGAFFSPMKEEKLKEPKKTIDIVLENAPIDEIHPLFLGSSKRIRVNDKMNNSKKVIRQS